MINTESELSWTHAARPAVDHGLPAPSRRRMGAGPVDQLPGGERAIPLRRAALVGTHARAVRSPNSATLARRRRMTHPVEIDCTLCSHFRASTTAFDCSRCIRRARPSCRQATCTPPRPQHRPRPLSQPARAAVDHGLSAPSGRRKGAGPVDQHRIWVVVDPRTPMPLLIMDFRPHPGAGRAPDRLINSSWGVVSSEDGAAESRATCFRRRRSGRRARGCGGPPWHQLP